ncbi:MAG: cytochrome c nitrite reductase small subunit [Chloroflexi bacterium]|nr:cytochrome c nitrite reductase small subunit [Chloroflexota bacterium]
MDEPIRAPDPPSPGRRRATLLSFAPLGIWLALAGLLGGIAGLGGFTFNYANGLSYLSNDPKACVNCHVMRDVYDGWNRGSHKHVAVCNDCHVPHDSIISKYAVKALNGFRHSYAFTTGDFPEPIRILPFDRNITEHACLSCHGDLVAEISHADSATPTDCLTCHAGVGHGK